jgi:hypothetical protein
MSATLNANGAGASGQQTAGVVAQYQLSGTDGVVEHAGGISPYDSGTIVTQNRPGQAAQKLVDGTVQRASQIVADGTGPSGNFLVNPTGVGLTPTPATGTTQADGLSGFPGRE